MTLRPLVLVAAALLSGLALQAQITGKFYFKSESGDRTEGHRSPAKIIFEMNGKSQYANYQFGGQVNGVDQCPFKADQGDPSLGLQKGMKIRVQTDGREHSIVIDQDVDSPDDCTINIYMVGNNGYRIEYTISHDKFMSGIPGMG